LIVHTAFTGEFIRMKARIVAPLRPLGWMLFGCLLGGVALFANSIPNSFQSGDLVSASQLNDNFTSLLAAVTGAVPVGSVRAALLDETAFASAAGDPSTFDASTSKWALADGRTVTGSSYASLSGNTTLPDMRGVFLRGLNVGRSTATGDSDGGARTAGDYQGDQFAQHNHNTGAFRYLVQRNPGSGTTGAPTDSFGPNEPDILNTGELLAAGSGTETRPRNVSVYYYVRIN
jgi:hypothetical protein